MDKRFWAILGVIAVVVIGAIWVSDHKKTNAPSNNTKPTQHIEGTSSTGVKLVEYGDYECPYCDQYYPIVKEVAAMYANQISFQFRNLPLTQLHPNAFAGARAAEAASLQGKFWEMHDALYQDQTDWVNSSNPETVFEEFAAQLGLNVNKFKSDYASAQVNNVINADTAAFNKTGQELATPTFFLDGKHIVPNETVASFESFINNAIKQKGFTPKPITTTSTSSTITTGSNTAPQSTQTQSSSGKK